jgi:DNA primase
MKTTGEPLSFYPGKDTAINRWIIVEDQISAIKLSAYGYNAVALLGTHLNMSKVREIQRVAKEVVIALDADATNKAFKMAKEFGLAFDRVKVAIMKQDAKDTSAGEFLEIFGDE